MINEDRLSILPDNLLFIIISCLPFKEAVRTSELAKRWRFIPLSTRNMEFDERDFVKQPSDCEEIRKIKRREFVDFVMGWIGSYQDSCADKFRLTFSHPEDYLLEMEQCISFAIGRKARVLEFDFSDPTWDEDKLEYHRTCLQLSMNDDSHKSTIESLRLFSCNLPTISQTSQNFSALKSVDLGWIRLTAASVKNLLEKCPALESLSTKNCCYDGSCFEIIGPKLKTLVIEKCFRQGHDRRVDLRIYIAPNVRCFKYSGSVSPIEFQVLDSMEEAEFDFGIEKEYVEYGDLLGRLLLEIACVKRLTICTYMLQTITAGEEPFKLKPVLRWLKHLTLQCSLDINEFYGITFFLNSCPNLELLTIDLNVPARTFLEYEPPCKIGEHAFFLRGPYKIIYSCVWKKLKSVVVEGFKGEPNEVLVVRYLLKYGRFLESLHIKLSEQKAADGTSLEATYRGRLEKLLQCEIASKVLRVFLSRA